MAQTVEQQQASALINYARDVSWWLYRFSSGWGVSNGCKDKLLAALVELESAVARNRRSELLLAWDTIRRSHDRDDSTTREVLEMALDKKLHRLSALAEATAEV